MKYILLIMTILQVKTFWRNFKSIFSTTEKDINKLNKIMDKVEVKDEALFNGMMVLLMLLYVIFLSIYYMLIGVYLEGILFVILSCLFALQSWKNSWKAIQWVGNKEDQTLFKKTLFSRASNLVYLVYIGYFIYILITTW